MTDASKPLPTKVGIYVRLETQRPLSKSELRQFLETVDRFGPANNMTTVQVIGPKGGPEEVKVVSRKFADDRRQYDVPLKRDLTEREVVTILEAWDAFYPNGDFIIESSAADLNAKREMLADAIVVKQGRYEGLCEALAKTQHRSWINERTQEGWRFGEKYDRRAKTHPMLRPWAELPEKYRKVDTETPQTFIEELNQQGYMVVKADELDKLVEMAYGRGMLTAR